MYLPKFMRVNIAWKSLAMNATAPSIAVRSLSRAVLLFVGMVASIHACHFYTQIKTILESGCATRGHIQWAAIWKRIYGISGTMKITPTCASAYSVLISHPAHLAMAVNFPRTPRKTAWAIRAWHVVDVYGRRV